MNAPSASADCHAETHRWQDACPAPPLRATISPRPLSGRPARVKLRYTRAQSLAGRRLDLPPGWSEKHGGRTEQSGVGLVCTIGASKRHVGRSERQVGCSESHVGRSESDVRRSESDVRRPESAVSTLNVT